MVTGNSVKGNIVFASRTTIIKKKTLTKKEKEREKELSCRCPAKKEKEWGP